MRKFVSLFIILIFSKLIFSQSISDLVINDSLTIVNKKYKIQNNDNKISDSEKLNTFLKLTIDRNPATVFFYTLERFDTISEFNKVRDSLINNPDFNFEEVLRNFNYIDIDQDGDLDIIYDRFNPYWDFQTITIFINKNGDYKELEVPGFIITDLEFKNKKLISIKTFTWACCTEPFDHYKKFIFENDTIKQDYYLVVPSQLIVPRQSKFPKKIKRKNHITIINSISFSNFPILNKGQMGQILAQNKDEYFVEFIINFHDENDIWKYDKIWCWIKKENAIEF